MFTFPFFLRPSDLSMCKLIWWKAPTQLPNGSCDEIILSVAVFKIKSELCIGCIGWWSPVLCDIVKETIAYTKLYALQVYSSQFVRFCDKLTISINMISILPTLTRQELVTTCLESTTSTSGSFMATLRIHVMSKPYTFSHPGKYSIVTLPHLVGP